MVDVARGSSSAWMCLPNRPRIIWTAAATSLFGSGWIKPRLPSSFLAYARVVRWSSISLSDAHNFRWPDDASGNTRRIAAWLSSGAIAPYRIVPTISSDRYVLKPISNAKSAIPASCASRRSTMIAARASKLADSSRVLSTRAVHVRLRYRIPASRTYSAPCTRRGSRWSHASACEPTGMLGSTTSKSRWS